MTHPHNDPLTPDERALAERLARIGPHGEPSSALDARILAAAHDALAASTPHRRSRWPAAMGVAASLALAIGLAWQLRPQPEALPALEEGPVEATAPAVSDAVPTADAQAVLDATAEADEAAVPSAPGGEAAAEAVIGTLRRAAPPSAQVVSAPPEEPPVMIKPVAPPRMPKPPMVATPSPTPAPATTTSRERRERAPLRVAPEPGATAAPASRTEAADMAAPPPAPAAPTGDARAVTYGAPQPSAFPADDPVAEDAHLAPTAWLDRIRARRDHGDLDGARASLRLFRDRHPSLPIPDDLRALTR